MPKRDIIVIGGSAGSLEYMRTVIAALPADLPAAVFVVLHVNPRAPDLLVGSLARVHGLIVVRCEDGQIIEPGRIYPAPPDRHLIIAEDHIHLTRGPREGLHRPSINVTFRSAANSHREGVIGVLLSGMLDDGASGLWEIARCGGVTIVRDPNEAPFPSMPLSALRDVPVNYTLRAAQIAPLLLQLVQGAEVLPMPSDASTDPPERYLGFTCPECHGPLYEHQAKPAEFRCRVGHAFPLQSLLDQAASTQEQKLYEAMVSLQEGADLAEYAAARLDAKEAKALLKEAEQLRQQVSVVKKLIENRTLPSAD